MTVGDLLCSVFTVLLLCCAMVARPTRARCPAGWYVNGVQPSGSFECRPVLGKPENDLLDAVRRVVIDDERRLGGRLYCTGGATPRQDGRSVWCQR